MPLSRLVKKRSHINAVQHNETMDDLKLPRLSIAELHNRKVVTRELLHRQFSDTYAANQPSSTNLDDSEPRTPFLSRCASASVLNQLDVTSKPGPDVVRPLVAPADKLDIEQAINLLQELKKTASPEELVSLHRALLPVKEVSRQIAPCEDSTSSGQVPPDRRRSVMPPGLATRSGRSEDVLRKPQYSSTVHTPPREKREMWVHAAQRASGGKQNGIHTVPSSRPATPSEQPNTGAYHPGTLRITNGAASPEPSTISKLAAAADGEDGNRLTKLESSADGNVSQFIHQSERCRPIGPRHPQRSPRDFEQGRAEASERPRSPSASRPKVEAGRFSFDQIATHAESPSAPRVQQRWSDRAAHLSQEYTIDCEVGQSPFGEDTDQLELAKQLSAVRDAEDVDSDQFLDPHAHAMSKLTGNTSSGVKVDNAESEVHAIETEKEVGHPPGDELPVRALRKVDSGYGSDTPFSPRHQQGARDTDIANKATAQNPSTPGQEHSTPGQEQMVSASGTETPFKHANESVYTFQEILGAQSPAVLPTDHPVVNVSKRTSPLSLFKSKSKATKKSGSMDLVAEAGERPALLHLKTGPSLSNPMREPKKLQKRVPDAVRLQRQLESGRQSEINGNALSDSMGLTKECITPDGQIRTSNGQDAQVPSAAVAEDTAHRFRLRGKSFGRKRSKTNALQAKTEAVLDTPAFRTGDRRSISASVPAPTFPDSDGNNGLNQLSQDQVPDNSQSGAQAPTAHPPHTPTDSSQEVYARDAVLCGHQTSRTSAQNSQMPSAASQNAAQELPRDAPIPDAAPRAALEGTQRVIPIGAHGSVEDLFPEWQSRPAATPSPAPSPSSSYLQVRQIYKPRGQPSISSIPPLPQLPADIESKLSRADQMVAKKMKNSPRNSTRNSPLPSARHSEDFRGPAARPTIVPDDEERKCGGEVPRWSIDGSISLPSAGLRSQPASPQHDSQHPGWPGWEKQADLWRQRKIGMGHALQKSLDMVGKIPVDSEFAPPSPSIVVSRYITPLGADNAHNAQHNGNNNTAEKRARAYTYLFADDKENWLIQQDVHRTDSVDSTASYDTRSSDGRTAKADISRTGSANSSASSDATATSSNTSTGGSGGYMTSVVEKPTAQPPSGPFTPYRPSDAVRAERSRALSLARRSCNLPAGFDFSLPPMPQNTSATVLDRYSGGLGYGWDRSTGFGGSAGTRSSGVAAANRKSVKMSEDFGLDMSDVPVFLRKVC